MTFQFRAHHPSAYFRFALILFCLIALNITGIALLYPKFTMANEAAIKSVILILPWMVVLLLPSVILAILIYRSFVKTYQLTFTENPDDHPKLTVERLGSRGKTTLRKDFYAAEIIEARIVDFEDNHYCNFRFREGKFDLVIHRDSGDFENFLNALAAFAPDAIKIAD